MSPTPPDERLDDMELRLTFLDDAVSSLGDSEAQQSRRLLQLESALAELRPLNGRRFQGMPGYSRATSTRDAVNVLLAES